MNYLYNKTFKLIRGNHSNHPLPEVPVLSEKALCWSLTQGEAKQMKGGRNLAIDEISNVIEFLDKLENEEIKGINFLELRACDESCAGGILCPGNRFLTAEKLHSRALKTEQSVTSGDSDHILKDEEKFLRDNILTSPILSRSIMKLDDSVAGAMIKMKRIYDLNGILPQVDCGICGSPSCKSLAEDIVQGNAGIQQCIFVQKILEQNEKMDVMESVEIMRKIWSDKKLDKNSLKDEINEIH
jgi:hypothetical protein